MMPKLTSHARTRMQQRGIRPMELEVLLDYGKSAYVPGGREIVFFDKAARSRLVKQHPEGARAADRFFRDYAILASDGRVVTVGKRFRHLRRH